MRTFAEKNCQVCGKAYQPTGSCSKYCIDCAKQIQKQRVRTASYNHAVKTGKIKQPGIGSGSTTGHGEDNHMYKDGLYTTIRVTGPRLHKERRFCEACGKDLKNEKNRHKVCIHHIDHDRTNNAIENLMLLCKACHQSYHKIHKTFEGATTISKESRVQENSKRPAPNKVVTKVPCKIHNSLDCFCSDDDIVWPHMKV